VYWMLNQVIVVKQKLSIRIAEWIIKVNIVKICTD